MQILCISWQREIALRYEIWWGKVGSAIIVTALLIPLTDNLRSGKRRNRRKTYNERGQGQGSGQLQTIQCYHFMDPSSASTRKWYVTKNRLKANCNGDRADTLRAYIVCGTSKRAIRRDLI